MTLHLPEPETRLDRIGGAVRDKVQAVHKIIFLAAAAGIVLPAALWNKFRGWRNAKKS